MGQQEEDHRGECPSHPVRSRVPTVNMTSLLMLALIIWLEVGFVTFLHYKIPLFLSPIVYYILWKKVTMYSPH